MRDGFVKSPEKDTPDEVEKGNYGFELGLFDKANIQFEYFAEYRHSIYQERQYVPETMGLTAPISSNVGEAKSHGIDFSIDYNHCCLRNIGRL